jgi:hypothetical protein
VRRQSLALVQLKNVINYIARCLQYSVDNTCHISNLQLVHDPMLINTRLKRAEYSVHSSVCSTRMSLEDMRRKAETPSDHVNDYSEIIYTLSRSVAKQVMADHTPIKHVVGSGRPYT